MNTKSNFQSVSPLGSASQFETFGSLLGKVLADADRKEQFKCQTRIVILAESDPDGEDLAGYLSWKGFQNVTHLVPNSNDRVDADVVIFHREDGTKRYSAIDNAFVADYIKVHWKSQSLLYFGTYNRELDVRNSKTVFANYRQKLRDNIFEMLEDLAYQPER